MLFDTRKRKLNLILPNPRCESISFDAGHSSQTLPPEFDYAKDYLEVDFSDEILSN